jgi:hypothetical protein
VSNLIYSPGAIKTESGEWVMARQSGDALYADYDLVLADRDRAAEVLKPFPGERLVELNLPDEAGQDHDVLYLECNRVKSPKRVVMACATKKVEENPGCLLGILGRRKAVQS